MKNSHRADEAIHDTDHLLAESPRLTSEAQWLRDKLKAVLAHALAGGA